MHGTATDCPSAVHAKSSVVLFAEEMSSLLDKVVSTRKTLDHPAIGAGRVWD